MADKLSLTERIEAAARMSTRAQIHFDLWWLTASREGRAEYAAIEDHWEHLRFLQHGQLVAVVGEVHALLDADKRTISLPIIVDEIERHQRLNLAKARTALTLARPIFRKLRILRNNVFAHRTARKSYDAMFLDAGMTTDQLRQLIELCTEVTNEILFATGCEPIEPSPLPKEHYGQMLKELGQR